MPKASQAPKKEHSGCTVIHAHALAEVTYSFYVLEGPTTFTDHCAEPRVFRAHFLVESRVNLDNWLYLNVINSRVVQRTAEALSGMTMEGSLQ